MQYTNQRKCFTSLVSNGMKYVLFTFMFVSALAVVPVGAQANEFSTLRDQAAQIELMQELLHELQALLEVREQVLIAGLDLQADEGFFPITVNEQMVFACADKVLTDGGWCVRSSSDLGISYVDLSYVDGFTYDGTGNHDLTLLKQRSETYGAAGTPQYNYSLFRTVAEISN